jgi:cytochrome c-type biogenesis protein CcmE
MHPIRRQRLTWILVIAVLLCCALALALYALRQNIDLFFTPQQLNTAPKNRPIRVGGWVVTGSVHHQLTQLNVDFIITDHHKNLTVFYQGILPDLFREGQAVVVEGQLNPQGQLMATQVLAKHDENYTPPQLISGDPDKKLRA